MRAESIWSQETMSIIHNDRNHGIVIDLPVNKGGEDKGATALELVIMAVPGCITTIFSMIAKNKDLNIEKLRCDVETIHDEGISLPTRIQGNLDVIVDDVELGERVWKQTQNACPVVKLVRNAGIEIEIKSSIASRKRMALEH